MDPVLIGALWLHLVATVALLGYYAALGLLVIPALRRSAPDQELGAPIALVERRALPVLVASLGVFLATGVYLMGTDPRYGALGDAGGSTAASLFLVKHLVVVGMIGLGLFIDSLIVRGIAAPDAVDRPAAVGRLVLAAHGMTVLGAIVLLLTAAGQVA